MGVVIGLWSCIYVKDTERHQYYITHFQEWESDQLYLNVKTLTRLFSDQDNFKYRLWQVKFHLDYYHFTTNTV